MIRTELSQYPTYKRPYFRTRTEDSDIQHQRPRYPYQPKLLLNYDIFPLFVLDGGAFFYTVEHIGAANGSDFVETLLSGKLLEPWIQDNDINWDKVIQGAEPGKPFPREKHCWINRLYFLLPIAQQFFRTRDEDWARLWLNYFEAWYQKHYNHSREAKLPRFLDIARFQITILLRMVLSLGVFANIKRRLTIARGLKWLAWADMQLSWRLMVITHSVFLINDSLTLRDEHWQRIYHLILDHAERIYREIVAELKTFGQGNHFLHKGVALLYAGLLFPEMAHAREYVTLARKVVSRHMLAEITIDGLSVESSPSYSHFIARLHLEALLLLKANGESPIAGLKECIRKQYRFLSQTATPSRLSLPFSDSYHLDIDVDKAIVRMLMPQLSFGSSESLFFEESSFAVLRNADFTVFIDGTREDLYHHHKGKPHIILYYCRFPLLIDSGCCNYDRKDYREWYATPESHNIVLVEPMHITIRSPDRAYDAHLRLFDFKNEVDEKAISMIREFESPSLNYSWQRRVIVSASSVDIIDKVSSKKNVKCTLLFHLAPSSVIREQETGIFTVSNPNWNVVIKHESENTNSSSIRQAIALSESNSQCYSPELAIRANGDEVKFRTILTLR